LTSINLGDNQLDERCSAALQTLASIPTLTDLGLAGNRISDTGARFLYQYRSAALKKISLFDNNNIKDAELITRGIEIGRS
jgi:hypothetical protein